MELFFPTFLTRQLKNSESAMRKLMAKNGQEPKDAEKIKQHFYSLRDFPGVSGPITFDANGDLERGYNIFAIENGSPKKL